MKTMTREEAILAMLDGKEVTSDEFEYPDYSYCIYNKNFSNNPFRFIDIDSYSAPISNFNIKTWRFRKYIHRYVPIDKELCWGYDNNEKSMATLVYYDAKFEATFNYLGKRDGLIYKYYAPFNGTPPPNIYSVDELED